MKLIRFLATTVSIAAVSSAAIAADSPQMSMPVSKSDVEAIVKQTIIDNPEIIMQALEKLRAQKMEQSKKSAKEGLTTYKTEIFEDKDVPAAGASEKDADVVLVEFFDYHCGYCKHFLPEITKLIAEDKKVRVRFMDFPILSEDSVTAAKAAIAVNRLDKSKYFEFHSALMKESGKFDEAKIMEIAKKLGIKTDKLKAEMDKDDVSDRIEKNRTLAKNLGITGTPGIVVGSEVVPGAIQLEELKKLVAKARAEKGKKADEKKPEDKKADVKKEEKKADTKEDEKKDSSKDEDKKED